MNGRYEWDQEGGGYLVYDSTGIFHPTAARGASMCCYISTSEQNYMKVAGCSSAMAFVCEKEVQNLTNKMRNTFRYCIVCMTCGTNIKN